MQGSRKWFVLAVVVVAVGVGVFFYTSPSDVDGRDAEGAIAAVEKHREAQIEADDVILGDETTRKQENALYAEFLEQSETLGSMSAALGSFAADLQARQNDADLGSLEADLQSLSKTFEARAQASREHSLEMIDTLLGIKQLESFHSDLQGMRTDLQSKSQLEIRQLQGFSQTLGAFANSLENRRSDDALEAMSAGLESMAKTFGNRNADLQLRQLQGFSQDLQQMKADLQAFQRFESRVMAESMVRNLDSRFQEEALITGVKSQLQALSKDLESRADDAQLGIRAQQLAARSADLWARAASLENRGLVNMESRAADTDLQLRQLEAMSAATESISQSLESRSASLDAKQMASFSNALGAFQQGLESRNQDFGEDSLGRMHAELQAIGRHLESRAEIQNRFSDVQSRMADVQSRTADVQSRAADVQSRSADVQSRADMQARAADVQSRADMQLRQNLQAFQNHLGSLNRTFEARQNLGNRGLQDELGAMAQKLESRVADM